MARTTTRPARSARSTAGWTMAALTASLMMGGCAGGLDQGTTDLLASASPPAAPKDEAPSRQTDLEKATEYWGKAYGKDPRNLDAALSYAKNLKALGQKGQALAVMQQAALYHGQNPKLASEYGRLALELDQLSVAAPLLEIADNPTNPDWRVISARGTVLAKQGKFKESIPLYERALTLANDNPSIVNNLAMSYAMSGEAAKAEELLRKAAASDGANAKVRQNLAIVLGLQGKHDEAKLVTAQAGPTEHAEHNSEILRKLVRNDAPAAAKPTVQQAKATTTAKGAPPAKAPVIQAKATPESLKPATNDAGSQSQDAAARVAENADGLPVFKPATR